MPLPSVSTQRPRSSTRIPSEADDASPCPREGLPLHAFASRCCSVPFLFAAMLVSTEPLLSWLINAAAEPCVALPLIANANLCNANLCNAEAFLFIAKPTPRPSRLRHCVHSGAMPLQFQAELCQRNALLHPSLLCRSESVHRRAAPLQFRLRNYHKAVSFRVSTVNSSENGSSEACTSAGGSFCEDFTMSRVPARLCVVSRWIGLFCVLRGLCGRGINTGRKEKDAVRGLWWPLAG